MTWETLVLGLIGTVIRAVEARGESVEKARADALAATDRLRAFIAGLPAAEKADHDAVVGDDSAWKPA